MFNLHAHQRFHLGCDPSSRELEEQAIRAFAWNDINRHDRQHLQYFMQMFFGFRATDANFGCYNQHLIYTPCFTLISMGIYNIEATMPTEGSSTLYAQSSISPLSPSFALSSYLNQGLYIGKWLYVMLALYFPEMWCHCIYMIVQEMINAEHAQGSI